MEEIFESLIPLCMAIGIIIIYIHRWDCLKETSEKIAKRAGKDQTDIASIVARATHEVLNPRDETSK